MYRVITQVYSKKWRVCEKSWRNCAPSTKVPSRKLTI